MLAIGLIGGVFIGLFIAAVWCGRGKPDKVVNIRVNGGDRVSLLSGQIKAAFKELDEDE